jgi:hypothetical protein
MKKILPKFSEFDHLKKTYFFYCQYHLSNPGEPFVKAGIAISKTKEASWRGAPHCILCRE